MRSSIDDISDIIEHMNRQLKKLYLTKGDAFTEKRLWKHTYVKHQMEHFRIQDHIQAMVYSMLSSGIP